MNYYNPYTGAKRKRLLKKILALLISVLIIVGVTVVFGNFLKKKADTVDNSSYMGIGRAEAETEGPVLVLPSDGRLGVSESVEGFCVPLSTDGDEASFEERITMAADGKNGVLIPLTGDDGFLLYNSVRAAEISRLPENPEIPTMAELGEAVAFAKSKGLRTCAYISSSVSFEDEENVRDMAIAADARIAADAAEAGFDEIIISSLVDSAESITSDTSHIILKYLNQMTAEAGDMGVGLSLPLDVYKTATLSPQIELFVSRSVFLTMELTREESSAENMNYICEKLAGTLSVYNMRMLLAPGDVTIGDTIVERLAAIGHVNYLYTCVPDEPEVDNTTETEIETNKND